MNLKENEKQRRMKDKGENERERVNELIKNRMKETRK